jgi:hypothetical protein
MVDCVMTGATPDECWPLIRDFHYSKRMPSAIRHCFSWREKGGLFGDTGELKVAAVYGNPVQFNWPQDALELQRLVRVEGFEKQLSEFVSWTLKWLKTNTTTPFVLSYADTAEGHHGGIYQSTNFLYVRETLHPISAWLLPNGEKKHPRQVNRELGSCGREYVLNKKPDWVPIKGEPKYLYVKPLRQKTKTLLNRFDWVELPYPKPNAARPLDKAVPTVTSQVQPLGAAPVFIQQKQEVNK